MSRQQTRISDKGGVSPHIASLRGRIAMGHRWGNITEEQIAELTAELNAETLIDRVEFLLGQYRESDPPGHYARRVANALESAASALRTEVGAA